MRFQYHELYNQQFEELVVQICLKLLGLGVQPFSSGPDGGRDARFQGTAAKFPSTQKPYSGMFVVQAKHTENPIGKFSDTDFSGNSAKAVITQEIPRIRRLVTAMELDHYLLFSNRRLAGTIDATIRKRIINETGAKTVELFGIERIDMILKDYPSILSIANISEVNAPLRVTPDDFAEIIIALSRTKDTFSIASEEFKKIARTKFDRKNVINNLSDDFARHIRKEYLKDFEGLRSFLANPQNDDILTRYTESAIEFNEQIIVHRDEFTSLDKVLLYIQKLLWERDGDLARNKRLTKLVLYYMYWNCDIGEEDEKC